MSSLCLTYIIQIPVILPDMQVVDRVFSNINRKNYDTAGSTPLDRLFHAMHMLDFWEMALIQYKQLVATNASKVRCFV